MPEKRITLSEPFVEVLNCLPETGMGYQDVKIILKNGIVIRHQTVLNATILVLKNQEEISLEDIHKIEVESKDNN